MEQRAAAPRTATSPLCASGTLDDCSGSAAHTRALTHPASPRPAPADCDGGSQTGDLADPVSVSGSTIYYRGHRILGAVQDAVLNTVGVASATDVIVSGCSAGGLSTFLHADSWAVQLPKAKVAAMPDRCVRGRGEGRSKLWSCSPFPLVALGVAADGAPRAAPAPHRPSHPHARQTQ